MSKTQKQAINWRNILVLILPPLAVLFLVPYYILTHGFKAMDWFWFGAFIIATGLSITAGYHRLWSHRSYKANKLLKIFFMLFGAATLQNSIIVWASDHRKHHRFVDDKEKDPYAATKGFWYSHCGWLMRKSPKHIARIENVTDLQNDKIVAFQHRYYIPISFFMCFVLPILIGATYGSIIGCFILAGLLRLVINHHFTFLINSLAHIWGTQHYSDKNTARDNPFLSLLTFGEGYHNFHHKYAGDYRNGVRWYDYDPAKWTIFLASKIGCAYDLKRTPKAMIKHAKISMQLKHAQNK